MPYARERRWNSHCRLRTWPKVAGDTEAFSTTIRTAARRNLLRASPKSRSRFFLHFARAEARRRSPSPASYLLVTNCRRWLASRNSLWKFLRRFRQPNNAIKKARIYRQQHAVDVVATVAG